MYQLSLSNIDLIKSDISRQRVSYSHLLDDLLDHVCCDVEKEMDKGLSFEIAYSNVRSKIGSNRFKKIQEETLFMIDKKYRTMKTFMKIFGALSPTLLAMGALFKIMHWPGAGIFLTLGFFFLCFFFLPSSVYVLYTENKSSKKHLFMHLSGLFSTVIILLGILFKVQHWPSAGILLPLGMVLAALVFLPSLVFSKISDDKGEGKKSAYLAGLFAGLLYIAGFLFKIMHWPGAGILILLGLIITVAVFLPAYSYAHFKNEVHVKGSFIFLTFVVMMAVLTISLMSLTVSKNVFNEFVVTETQMENVLDDLTAKTTILAENLSINNQTEGDFVIISEKANEIDHWIEALKRELISIADPESKALKNDKINYKHIINKSDTNIPFEVLIGPETNGKAYQLEEMLVSYKEMLLSASNDNKFASSVNLLLDLSQEPTMHEHTYSWVEFQFNHRTLISTLNSLTCIQIQVRLAEKEMIETFCSKEIDSEQNIIAAENSSL